MEQGGRRPDAPKLAQATVRAVVAEALGLLPELDLVAGGKSFGGRMTSQAQAASPLPGGEAALGLLAGAGRLLRPDGVLVFYGPFMLGGTHTAASNAAFDADLKRRDPRWGVRDVDDLLGQAAPHGLDLREVVAMPVNNLSLVFVKATPAILT
jgi:hypothetical protein